MAPEHFSRVLVFENLVALDEVDDELSDEVKCECDKFGEVESCLVHTVPSEELVRVFVVFGQ